MCGQQLPNTMLQIHLRNLHIHCGLTFGMIFGLNDLVGFIRVTSMKAGAFAGLVSTQ